MITREAREWLAKNNITDLADAWDRCHRADWMLWLDKDLDLLTDRERRLIACRCVRDTPLIDGRKVWDLLTDERSRRAVTVAERYADGDATDEQLVDAWNAARVAAQAAAAAAAAARVARDAAAPAADAAASAAWAATEAATAWATEGEEDADLLNVAGAAAAEAARDAAQAAATDPAETATWAAARAAQAAIVREIAGNPWRKEA